MCGCFNNIFLLSIFLLFIVNYVVVLCLVAQRCNLLDGKLDHFKAK
jgi:hypothetical protein